MLLCWNTRHLPAIPHLAERVYTVADQHNLSFPGSTSRPFVGLFLTALEEYLTNIIRQSITTVTSSERYDSIQLDAERHPQQNGFRPAPKPIITLPALATTILVTPSLVPYASPAVQRLLTVESHMPIEEAEDDPTSKKPKNNATPVHLNASPLADFYRLLRVSRSGGSRTLEDFSFS